MGHGAIPGPLDGAGRASVLRSLVCKSPCLRFFDLLPKADEGVRAPFYLLTSDF